MHLKKLMSREEGQQVSILTPHSWCGSGEPSTELGRNLQCLRGGEKQSTNCQERMQLWKEKRKCIASRHLLA